MILGYCSLVGTITALNMIQRNDQPAPLPEGECPLCGYVMDGYQCKLVCPNCGYREDCSDTFRSGPMEPPQEQDQPASPTPPQPAD